MILPIARGSHGKISPSWDQLLRSTLIFKGEIVWKQVDKAWLLLTKGQPDTYNIYYMYIWYIYIVCLYHLSITMYHIYMNITLVEAQFPCQRSFVTSGDWFVCFLFETNPFDLHTTWPAEWLININQLVLTRLRHESSLLYFTYPYLFICMDLLDSHFYKGVIQEILIQDPHDILQTLITMGSFIPITSHV